MSRKDLEQHTCSSLLLYGTLAQLAYLDPETLTAGIRAGGMLPQDWCYLDRMSAQKVRSSQSRSSLGGSVDSCVGIINKFTKAPALCCYSFKNEGEKEVVIAFKGTHLSSASDLKADALIANGTGFDIPKEIRDFVNDVFNQFKRQSGYKITLVGHSLGAYIAIKMLLILKPELIDKMDSLVIAFEAPGIETAQIHNLVDKGKNIGSRIHRFSIRPNLINTVNFQAGRLFILPSPKREQDSLYAMLKSVLATEEATSQFKGFMLNNVVFPTVAASVNRAASMLNLPSPELTADAIQRIHNNTRRSVEELQGIKSLKAKVDSTLATHSLNTLLLGLGENISALGIVYEIDNAAWPSLSKLAQTDVAEWRAPQKPPAVQSMTTLGLSSLFSRRTASRDSSGVARNMEGSQSSLADMVSWLLNGCATKNFVIAMLVIVIAVLVVTKFSTDADEIPRLNSLAL